MVNCKVQCLVRWLFLHALQPHHGSTQISLPDILNVASLRKAHRGVHTTLFSWYLSPNLVPIHFLNVTAFPCGTS